MRESELFTNALRLDSPDRAAYLAAACGGDAGLRAAVEALLHAHESDPDFLEPPVGSTDGAPAHPDSTRGPMGAGATPADDPVGTTLLGRYCLRQVIGEGGMGTVWRADQTEPVRRAVAVKLIKPGKDTRQVLGRFDAERQALALMDHPHIARVFDAGATETGRPFFVMELVDGIPINRFCDARRLSVRQRLSLFADVCRAVQHAHQKGVIHRDLKPSNVLVAEVDGRPMPKVIDFGVAKATGPPLAADGPETEFGVVIGTPEYASPEQAALGQQDVDTRADIYSLGVLLYELLTGAPPVERAAGRAGVLDVLRAAREDEPPLPSRRLAAAPPALAAARRSDPRRLAAGVRGDLDAIVMTCLEKDRERRYPTAGALADDTARWLGGEPVDARPVRVWGRWARRARRHPALTAMAGALAAAVLAAVVLPSMFWRRAEAAREQEAALRRVAEEREDRLLLTTARLQWADHDLPGARESLNGCRPHSRTDEWRSLWRACRPPVLEMERKTYSGAAYWNSGGRLFYSPNGRVLAALLARGAIIFWDADAGRELGVYTTGQVLKGCAFQDNGHLLVGQFQRDTSLNPKQGALIAIDLAKGATRTLRRFTRPNNAFELALDGSVGISWTAADRLVALDVATGMERSLTVPGLRAAAFAIPSGGEYVVTAPNAGDIVVWDLATWTVHGRLPRAELGKDIQYAALAPDASQIVLKTTYDGHANSLIVRQLDPPGPDRVIPVGMDRIAWAEVSPDGRLVAARIVEKNYIGIWQLDTGAEVVQLRGHPDLIVSAAFHPNGRSVAVGGVGGRVAVWDIGPDE
jgi:eukaryotic-like serine/threonine-protein kinase